MEKVKLPKEVAEAIDYMRNDKQDNRDILNYALGSANGPLPTTLREFTYGRSFDELLQALVNGYEVEETPEDKVRGRISHWKKMQEASGGEGRGFEWLIEGAETILHDLNIKIEGVNT